MEFFYLYLLTALQSAAALLAVTSAAIFFWVVIYLTDHDLEETAEVVRRYLRLINTVFILTIAAIIFVPTNGQIKLIIGAGSVWYTINATSNIEGMDKLPKNFVKAANIFLERAGEHDQQP